MKKYRYKVSGYGKMRDRMEEKRKAEESKQKRKEEDYYAWLVQGK